MSRFQFVKKKMNHGGTRPQLIKIHKYFENFLRQFRTKSRGGAWGGGGGCRAAGGRVVNFEGIFVFFVLV